MCYENCRYENRHGECTRCNPPCERTGDDVSEYEDRLYDLYKDGEISKSQAMSMMQKFKP